MGQLCHGLAGLSTAQLAAVVNIHLWPAFTIPSFIQRTGVHALIQPSSILISPLSCGKRRRQHHRMPPLPFSRLLQVFYLPFSSSRHLFLLQPLPAVLPVSGSSLAFFIAFGYCMSLPNPRSSVPAQAHMYHIHFIHSYVMAAW